MQRRPLVAFAAFWTAGSAIQSLWQGVPAVFIYAGLLLALTAYSLAVRLSLRLVLALMFALLLSGGERMWVESGQASLLEGVLDHPEEQFVTLSGRMLTTVSIDGDLVTFQLQTSNLAVSSHSGEEQRIQPLKEKLLVRIKLTAETELVPARTWRRGMQIRLQGELQRPATAGNFGGFDYRHYLEQKGVYWVLSAKGATSVQLLADKPTLAQLGLRKVDEAREAIGALMDRLYRNGDAGYMKGLVIGIQDDIDPSQYDAFSRLGLTHVLAISGLHVAVIVFILLRLTAFFRLTRERSLEVAIAAMPVYMLLTGASPSAVRACLMAMIALYMARRHLLKDGLHLLAASALIMMVWQPLVVEDVSFQLSFIVTAGLILYVPVMTELLGHGIKHTALRNALAVALTAQLASFPLTAFYFHQLHLLSLLANLVLVPFISFIVMPLGMAAVALGAIWLPLGMIPARLAELGNRVTFHATDGLGSVKAMATVWPQPSLAWVAVAYLLLAMTGFWLKRTSGRFAEERLLQAARAEQQQLADPFDAKRRAREVQVYRSVSPAEGLTQPLIQTLLPTAERYRRGTLVTLACLLSWMAWLVWGIQPAFFDRHAEVLFLDVGQGDSILIRTGTGQHILVDTGGTVSFGKPAEAWRQRRDPYEVGRKTLVPLLKQRGIRSLDALVLTHLDGDHIGGAEALLRELQVKRILFNGTLKPTADVFRLFQMANESGIPLYAVHAGMNWQVDASARIEILYPDLIPPDQTAWVEDQNDYSVVTKLTLYGRTFLLPGDLEKAGELAVVDALSDGQLVPTVAGYEVDVLKAGHHGSKTSTSLEWLGLWRPAEVVISVGKNNTYGHPNPEVVQRIMASQASMFRTDLNGEVQYRIAPDGQMMRRSKRP